MAFRTMAAVFLGIVCLVFAWTGTAPAMASAPSAFPFGEANPVKMVILADESGSMQDFPNEIAGEQQAAVDIIQAAWSPHSQVAVYGFGSAPPSRGASASQAVDKLCALTELNTTGNLVNLTRCAHLIAPRQAPENNTDFAAALDAAENVLSAPDPLHRVPLVFILTDGMLDVGQDSPYAPFPSTDQQGNAAAQQQLSGTILPSLKSAGIEVWPLGFGEADASELSQFAHGGAQVNPYCSADTDAAPKLTSVPSAVTGAAETHDIQQDLLSAFAAASCGTITPGAWTTLPPDGSVTVPVMIDPLTTLGSIVVNKGNPQVRVTYTDPDGGRVSDGSPHAGTLDGAAFVLTGGGTQLSQEALRLDGPVPGPWKVTFTNPSSVVQSVGVSVVWQGQAFPDINFSPQVGDSGQPLQIQVRPAIHAAPVPASELSRLTVSLSVQWSRGGAPQQVTAKLNPATGEFTGSVPVPSGQKGVAVVTATMQEHGVQGTAVAKVNYQPGGGMNVGLDLPQGIRVSPGGSLTETAIVNNLGRPPTSIEFLLAGLGSGVVASIVQPSHPVSIGSGRVDVPVMIRFAPGTRRGPALGTIQWEVTGSNVKNTAAFVDVSVEPPPTPWYLQWWSLTLFAIIAAGLAGVLILWWWRRWHRSRDVQHVGIALIRPNGPPTAPYVRWSGGFAQARWFRVTRKGPAQTPALIETTPSGAGVLELRRDPVDRKLTLTVHVAPPAQQEMPKASQPPSGPSAAPSRPSPPRPSPSAQAPSGSSEPVPEAIKPPVGERFTPPPSVGLDGCQLQLVEFKPAKKHDEANPLPDAGVRTPRGGGSGGRLPQRRPNRPLVVGRRRDTNGQQDTNGQHEGL